MDFQIVMFLMFGLLVESVRLVPMAGVGILIGFYDFSRPISVFLCLFVLKMSFGIRFLLRGGIGGAVPIIFATYPWIKMYPNAK